MMTEQRTQPVDLIVLNDALPILQHRVLKHGRLLYGVKRAARRDFTETGDED
ncbi:MAG: hypothetical protein SVX38_02050 [Chloroflexota bacterium]|nr:hypothetical protein [Chloroflexota bacterium]